jgi:hypothetical protein
MNLLETESRISVLKDPFKKECLRDVLINICRRSDGTTRTWGKIEFVNGNTVGQQKFEAETFDALMAQMRAFIETIK